MLSAMSDIERLVDSILVFLRSTPAHVGLTQDQIEMLTVAAQCIENSYGRTGLPFTTSPPDLLQLFINHAPPDTCPPPSPEPIPAPVSAPTPVAAPPVTPLIRSTPIPIPTPAPAPAQAPPHAGAAAAAAFLSAGPLPFALNLGQSPHPPAPPVNPEDKARSENLKNEGNALMKCERYADAMAKYTDAIAKDPNNPIFYCNRAAAHSSLKNNDAAIEDCKLAIAINPRYGRAYGRLGLALTNLEKHLEARDAYKIAVHLEPDNEAYRNNLAVTEETLRRNPAAAFPSVGVDLSNLLHNQTLANVATQMLSDPALQTFMGRLLGDLGGGGPSGEAAAGGGGLNVLLQAGQQLAQQMQQSNPELVEQLRQQMTNQTPAQPPAQPPPKPPQ